MNHTQTLMRCALRVLALLGLVGGILPSGVAQSLSSLTQQNCSMCHAESTKGIGPSWSDIRQRYNQLDGVYLQQKILSGGAGKWGPMPMPKSNISASDADAIVIALNLKQGSQPTVPVPMDDPKVFGRSARGG